MHRSAFLSWGSEHNDCRFKGVYVELDMLVCHRGQFYLLCGLEVADDEAAILLVFLPICWHVSRWNDLRKGILRKFPHHI